MIRITLAFSLMAWTALAAPPPGVEIDPALHAWFERQHNVNGGWCCDLGDGHILDDADWRAITGSYEVRIQGVWHTIPVSVMRDPGNDPNPTGKAIVWYRAFGPAVTIYCFAPGVML